jgi:hypothetical protein
LPFRREAIDLAPQRGVGSAGGTGKSLQTSKSSLAAFTTGPSVVSSSS